MEAKVEEIRPGLVLPPLVVTLNSRQLVLWAAASGDFYEVHYDLDYAKSHGMPGIILHGTLKLALLGRAVTSWFGANSFVRRISASYRGMDLVNLPFTVRGEVTEVTRESGLLVAEIRLVGVSADDVETTPGAATVDLLLPDGGAA